MSATQCRNHPQSPALAICAGCQASICGLCTTFDGFDRCATCHSRFAQKRAIRNVVLGVVLVAGLGAGGFFLTRHIRGTLASGASSAKAFDYGKYAQEIKSYRQKLEQEPCARDVIVPYGEALNRAGDKRGAIAVVDAYIARCGKYERLLWVKFSALKQLSEFKSAGDVAGELISMDPNDHDYWWWRAEALELAGELDQAAADYRQAIATTPNLRNIPMNLASVYERLDMPCESLATLETYSQYYPEVLGDLRFSARLEKLRSHPKCSVPSSKGSVSIRLDASCSCYVATVSINETEGTFLVDTGATAVTVTDEFAQKAGLATSGKRVQVKTANGTALMRVTTANTISLKDLQVHAIPTLVARTLPEDGFDGFLGMSFLNRFDVQVNGAKRLMTIRSRPEALARP